MLLSIVKYNLSACFVSWNLQQLDEDDSRQQQDQESLNEQQMLTVNRVLTSSVELTDE